LKKHPIEVVLPSTVLSGHKRRKRRRKRNLLYVFESKESTECAMWNKEMEMWDSKEVETVRNGWTARSTCRDVGFVHEALR
jgi:hypothetical protein